MDSNAATLAATVQALRSEFDQAFAQAPAPAPPPRLALLAIRVGSTPYAIRLADIGGLHVDRSVLALPSALPELRGVTGLRGQIIPVYDLACLLGLEPAQAPRWMVLSQSSQPLAFAFDAFEAHVVAAPGQLLNAGADGQGALRHAELVRPILDLKSLAGDIQQRIDVLQRTRSIQS